MAGMKQRLEEILEKVPSGKLTTAKALDALEGIPSCDLDFAKVDHHREVAKGTPEIVFGLGKTPVQIGRIAREIDGAVLLCGDTLFSLGCGRLSEGTAADMFSSLRKFASMPGETQVCCGHEYTESNARFALHADPGNAALQAYAARVKQMRAAGRPTVPSRLADELAANPFLRAPDVAAFADLRARKDKF